jgi:hypothetical protein
MMKLSALNKEKASDALMGAIDLVDKRAAAAKAAVGSMGAGLGSAAADLKIGSVGVRDRVSYAAGLVRVVCVWRLTCWLGSCSAQLKLMHTTHVLKHPPSNPYLSISSSRG